jgi:hypothetical protein
LHTTQNVVDDKHNLVVHTQNTPTAMMARLYTCLATQAKKITIKKQRQHHGASR